MNFTKLMNFLNNYDKVQISFIVKKEMVYFNALIIDPNTKKHYNHNVAFTLYDLNQLVDENIILDQIKDIVQRLDRRMKSSLI